MLLTLFL